MVAVTETDLCWVVCHQTTVLVVKQKKSYTFLPASLRSNLSQYIYQCTQIATKYAD